MFESLQDYSSKGKFYLVNQLFYIIYDEMSDIVNGSQSIKEMMNKWSESKQYVDFDYLIENYDLLEQPFWMKFLLRRKFYRAIFVMLKLKRGN